MIDIELLDDSVLEDICANMKLDSGNENDMKKVAKLSADEAFERFLTWNGIIGYGDMISSALDNIRLAHIDDSPYPIPGDDGTKDCVSKGHCGCGEGEGES